MKISSLATPPLAAPARAPLAPARPALQELGTAQISFQSSFGALGVVTLSARGKTLARRAVFDEAVEAARKLSVGKHGAVAVVWKSPSARGNDARAFDLRRVAVPDVQASKDDPSAVPITAFHPERSWPGTWGALRETLSIHGRLPDAFSSVEAIVDGEWVWDAQRGVRQLEPRSGV